MQQRNSTSVCSFCEKHTGKKMDWDRLAAVVELSDKTWDLFIDTYELRKAMPTPMDTGDAMNTMVPCHVHAGDPGGLRFLHRSQC